MQQQQLLIHTRGSLIKNAVILEVLQKSSPTRTLKSQSYPCQVALDRWHWTYTSMMMKSNRCIPSINTICAEHTREVEGKIRNRVFSMYSMWDFRLFTMWIPEFRNTTEFNHLWYTVNECHIDNTMLLFWSGISGTFLAYFVMFLLQTGENDAQFNQNADTKKMLTKYKMLTQQNVLTHEWENLLKIHMAQWETGNLRVP